MAKLQCVKSTTQRWDVVHIFCSRVNLPAKFVARRKVDLEGNLPSESTMAAFNTLQIEKKRPAVSISAVLEFSKKKGRDATEERNSFKLAEKLHLQT